jgi:hypothetical protein
MPKWERGERRRSIEFSGFFRELHSLHESSLAAHEVEWSGVQCGFRYACVYYREARQSREVFSSFQTSSSSRNALRIIFNYICFSFQNIAKITTNSQHEREKQFLSCFSVVVDDGSKLVNEVQLLIVCLFEWRKKRKNWDINLHKKYSRETETF